MGIEGLDLPEMGIAGYCGIVMDKASESPVSQGWDEPRKAPKVESPSGVPETPFVNAYPPTSDGKNQPQVPTRTE